MNPPLLEVDSRTLPDLPNDPTKTNWVEKSGGLPNFIDRIAKHLKAKGMTTGHAIATAVNQCRKVCATGRTFGGKTEVSAEARARYCKGIAEWEAKKAKTKVAKGAKAVTEEMRESIVEEATFELRKLRDWYGVDRVVEALGADDNLGDAVRDLSAIIEVFSEPLVEQIVHVSGYQRADGTRVASYTRVLAALRHVINTPGTKARSVELPNGTSIIRSAQGTLDVKDRDGKTVKKIEGKRYPQVTPLANGATAIDRHTAAPSMADAATAAVAADQKAADSPATGKGLVSPRTGKSLASFKPATAAGGPKGDVDIHDMSQSQLYALARTSGPRANVARKELAARAKGIDTKPAIAAGPGKNDGPVQIMKREPETRYSIPPNPASKEISVKNMTTAKLTSLVRGGGPRAAEAKKELETRRGMASKAKASDIHESLAEGVVRVSAYRKKDGTQVDAYTYVTAEVGNLVNRSHPTTAVHLPNGTSIHKKSGRLEIRNPQGQPVDRLPGMDTSVTAKAAVDIDNGKRKATPIKSAPEMSDTGKRIAAKADARRASGVDSKPFTGIPYDPEGPATAAAAARDRREFEKKMRGKSDTELEAVKARGGEQGKVASQLLDGRRSNEKKANASKMPSAAQREKRRERGRRQRLGMEPDATQVRKANTRTTEPGKKSVTFRDVLREPPGTTIEADGETYTVTKETNPQPTFGPGSQDSPQAYLVDSKGKAVSTATVGRKLGHRSPSALAVVTPPSKDFSKAGGPKAGKGKGIAADDGNFTAFPDPKDVKKARLPNDAVMSKRSNQELADMLKSSNPKTRALAQKEIARRKAATEKSDRRGDRGKTVGSTAAKRKGPPGVKLSDQELTDMLRSSDPKTRAAAQQEMVKRGRSVPETGVKPGSDGAHRKPVADLTATELVKRQADRSIPRRDREEARTELRIRQAAKRTSRPGTGLRPTERRQAEAGARRRGRK